MIRAKLTRPDGSVLELEGTSEEVSSVLAWESCSGAARVEAKLIIAPLTAPFMAPPPDNFDLTRQPLAGHHCTSPL